MSDDKTRGLYAKYSVERTDGKAVGQCFVLEVKDPNTWPALREYAVTVMADYPQLAKDVRDMVRGAQVVALARQLGCDGPTAHAAYALGARPEGGPR